MKVLNVKQIQQADAHTIEHEPIASIDLMERAARQFAEAFAKRYDKSEHIAIVCGQGNNGGDGLAVTRLLDDMGYQVDPIVVQPKSGGSKDFLINLDRLPKDKLTLIKSSTDTPDFSRYTVVIDAIFGSGLTRGVTGLFAEVIKAINDLAPQIVAIDIPSGLFMDHPAPAGAIIQANVTISFQLPKLAFFFPENHNYVGEWELVNIGLDGAFIDQQDTPFFAIDHKLAKSYLPPKSKYDHKGSYGHALLIGGSYGKIGAVVLAAEAALRMGTGLVSANIPLCGQEIMQTALPEAMLVDQPGQNEIQEFNVLDKANVIGLGPGLGTKENTVTAYGDFLRRNSKPLVIDADGINILAERTEYLELLPKNTILTPHLKEFDRLAGDSENNWQRLDKARALTRRLNVIIVLKGAHTAIIEPDGKVTFNTTGNPGMATAGSGDVLLGMITGLLAQGITAAKAAILGAYLHGLAADLNTSYTSQRSLIAGDIITSLGEAFIELER